MKYFYKGIVRGLKGLPIGLAIGYSFMVAIVFFKSEIAMTTEIALMNYLMAAFVGFYLSGVTVVYEIEEWSIMKQSFYHSILSLPYIPLAFYIGWAPEDFGGRVLFVIAYIIVFMAIWLSFRTYWKYQAERMNSELNKFRK